MALAAKERLARLLSGAGPDPAFSTQGTVPADALDLSVDGSPVPLPIRAAQAKRLIAAAQPATFGLRERTVTDTSVRDTWQVPVDRVGLGGSRWDAELARILEQVADDLGLSVTTRLRAEPHALLVYGKGQFFAAHQDSEKDDAMVATLVVSLPSAHTGGELIVDHCGAAKTYHGSRDEIRYVAFYPDCRHEVLPVRSGHRVSLTFDLLATEEKGAPALGPVEEAAALLAEHFATPGMRWNREVAAPRRLVFLLDHEYTQRGLVRGRLKGADAERVAVLRAAADQAGCETAFALAEIQQTWDAYPADESWGDRHDGWDDDDSEEESDHGAGCDPDDGSSDYELNELIDDAITLGWWSADGGEEISLAVSEEQVCAATATKELTPYESEYEGYMGNYGNTVDRWYRRAAVVAWPREQAFGTRAEASPGWALRQVGELLAAGEVEQAREHAAQAAPYWAALAATGLPLALAVALGLEEAGAATELLKVFAVELYGPRHAVELARLAERYGEGWVDALVGGYVNGSVNSAHAFARGAGRAEWITETLPALCARLRAQGAIGFADSFAAQTWGSLLSELRVWLDADGPRERRATALAGQAPLIASVLKIAGAGLVERIVVDLGPLRDDLLAALVPALCSPGAQANHAVRPLIDPLRVRLEAIAGRPPRAEDDWSISWTGCGCDLCAALAAFVRSDTARRKDWPLREDRRRHIHGQIDRADLPVRHQTRRQGRPYTLVLTKTSELFDREARDRAVAKSQLAALSEAYR